MIVSSEVSTNDVEDMLLFYKQHFGVVDVVKCEECGAYLCFELEQPVADWMGLQVNELGRAIVPIGNALQSSRVRLDKTPTGERMVGYQCGNMVPNPAFDRAEKRYAAQYSRAQKDHDKILDQYDKQHKAALKKLGPGDEAPTYNPPAFVAPKQHGVPPVLECGNDSRLAEVERGRVPTGKSVVHLSPFEKAKIMKELNNGYEADYTEVGNKKFYEKFSVERVQ